MDPTYTLKPQLRIKITNIYLDETVTLIQYIKLTSALLWLNVQNLAYGLLGNVMLAITRSFHFFYPAVCAHVYSITCYHLKLFILIICKSHCTVQICITNKLHDYIAWSHLMLCC